MQPEQGAQNENTELEKNENKDVIDIQPVNEVRITKSNTLIPNDIHDMFDISSEIVEDEENKNEETSELALSINLSARPSDNSINNPVLSIHESDQHLSANNSERGPPSQQGSDNDKIPSSQAALSDRVPSVNNSEPAHSVMVNISSADAHVRKEEQKKHEEQDFPNLSRPTSPNLYNQQDEDFPRFKPKFPGETAFQKQVSVLSNLTNMSGLTGVTIPDVPEEIRDKNKVVSKS
eukprot:UN31341